ncbi:MAG: hypothetical protein H6612_04445 [Ignavibacteriales bacterium]|nr:hypothetical protein [Ignavibacteriales bacterium]MCB9258583.1 hypothetical protein [Ignavibacteriales bacterium]
MKGDYRNEAEDAYVKMIEKDTKKSLMLKIGMGAIYISLLIISLFVV